MLNAHKLTRYMGNRPLLTERCFISNDEIIFSDVVIDKPTIFKCNINNLNDITPYKGNS